MHSYQGNLDGLCGPYAIVNAMFACNITEKDLVFQHACSSLAKQRWPSVLWNGTYFYELKKMALSCIKIMGYDHFVEISSPFEKNPAKSNNDYWQKFDILFDDTSTVCAIIGLSHPSSHWIVAYRDGTRIVFVDSNPVRTIFKKNRSSIFAGQRSPKKNAWLVDRSEILLFARK